MAEHDKGSVPQLPWCTRQQSSVTPGDQEERKQGCRADRRDVFTFRPNLLLATKRLLGERIRDQFVIRLLHL